MIISFSSHSGWPRIGKRIVERLIQGREIFPYQSSNLCPYFMGSLSNNGESPEITYKNIDESEGVRGVPDRERDRNGSCLCKTNDDNEPDFQNWAAAHNNELKLEFLEESMTPST
ncbi:hypothetical protein AAHA92_09480 [Salvia divinorum]|uniref:Uncharacterized protein n=1 Tax=Salvia divinorum TaxID=28513 RepID=A0ABD1HSB4_SALDI